MAGVSILFIGYFYGYSDMAVYIPLIRRVLDPTFLHNDWSVAHEGGIHSPFIWAMAQLGRPISLETASLSVHILERFLLAVGVYLLSQRLYQNPVAGFVSVLVVTLSSQWNLGGNPIAASVSIPHTLAIVPAVFALYCASRGWRWQATALAGVATYFHVLIGLEVMLLLGAYMAWRDGLRDRSAWIAWATYAVVAAPMLAPLALRQLHSMGSTTVFGTEYVDIIGGLRAPWHYLPSSWPPSVYVTFLVYLLAGGICAYFARSAYSQAFQRQAIFFVALILALCLVGTVFVEWIPSSLILKLQFFRLTVFIKIFVSLFIACYLTLVLQRRDPLQTGLALLALVNVNNPYLFAVFMTLTLACEVWQRRTRPTEQQTTLKRGLLGSVVALPAMATLGVLALLLWLPKVSELRAHLVFSPWPVLAVAAATVALWQLLVRTRAMRGGSAVLIVAILMSVVLLKGRFLTGPVTWSRIQVAALGRIQPTLTVRTDWDSLCAWIQQHTPRDAIFITPPYLEGFRLRAERAIVVDFKSTAYLEADVREWRDRLLDLTSHVVYTRKQDPYPAMRVGYQSLTPDAIRLVAAKYRATFVVAERPTRFEMPLLYENASYALYQILSQRL